MTRLFHGSDVATASGTGLAAFGVLGGIAITCSLLAFWKYRRSKRFPHADGVVISADVVQDLTTARMSVKYQYTVDDREYHSCRLYRLFDWHYGGATAEATCRNREAFKPGDRVRVFYEPEKPELAFLKHGPVGGIIGLGMIGCGMVGFTALFASIEG